MKNELNDIPCSPDHNGECLICDCWVSNCAYERFLNEDYTYETKEELEIIFTKYESNKKNKINKV